MRTVTDPPRAQAPDSGRLISLALLLLDCVETLVAAGSDALESGQLETAKARFEEAIAAAQRAGDSQLRIRAQLGLATILGLQGDARAEEDISLEALKLAREASDGRGIAFALGKLAGLALTGGRIEQASSFLSEAIKRQVEAGDIAGLASSLATLATISIQQGRHPEAAQLLGAAQALNEKPGVTGILARSGRAGEDHSDLIKRQIGSNQFDAAWAQGAAMTVDAAVAFAAEMIGGKVRARTGWDTLTKAETEVVALVAHGLDYAEIADRLFISRRTVEGHVGHVFGKLGISSRRELARRARAKGLGSPLPDTPGSTPEEGKGHGKNA